MGIIAAVLLSLASAQEARLSGPQPGEKTPGFKVFDVGSRGERDYLAEANGAPVVLVFVHELTRPAGALMRALDETGRIKEARGLQTRFISLSEDRDGAERHLPIVVRSLNLKCPLGISLDGKEGPGAYGDRKSVMLTILVVRQNQVAANFALVAPNETDAPRIRAAIDEVLKAASTEASGTAEERRLHEELAAAREEIASLKIQLEKSASAPPRRGEMEKPREDETLVNHCRRLIQRAATREQLDAAVKDIEGYIGTNEELKKQYLAILTRVRDLKYGNDLGQAEILRQLEKHGK